VTGIEVSAMVCAVATALRVVFDYLRWKNGR